MATTQTDDDEAAVAAHYDELDASYRSLWGEDLHHGLWITGEERPDQAVRQLTDAVVAAARLAPGMAVCDLGCGYGATTRRLVREHGCRALGITNSPVQYSYALGECGFDAEFPRFILGSWEQNGLPSGAFDAVLAIESLAHIVEKPRAFDECARVLRPGGRLVISDWYVRENLSRLQSRVLLEPIRQRGHLAPMCSRLDWEDLIRGAGLRPHRFVDLTDQVRRTWTVTITRTASRLARDRQARRFLRSRPGAGSADVARLLRIVLAMRAGSLRYGLHVAEKVAN